MAWLAWLMAWLAWLEATMPQIYQYISFLKNTGPVSRADGFP